MGEKDLSEKLLEDYNDVFADIVNVLLFHGKGVITPDSLEDTKINTQYKADDKRLHEMERDVAKLWKEGMINIALLGIENQTSDDNVMPIRHIGYDGSAYRSQLLKHADNLYPVVTIVLYFGLTPWRQPTSLKEILTIPAELDSYVNDYHVHVFEIAWLSDETIALFKSDFKIVADFFSQLRKTGHYTGSTQTIAHVDAVLKFLAVMGQAPEFEQLVTTRKSKEVHHMCEAITKMVQDGINQGISQGISQGITEGIEQVIFNSLRKGHSAEAIAEFVDLPLALVKKAEEKFLQTQ